MKTAVLFLLFAGLAPSHASALEPMDAMGAALKFSQSVAQASFKTGSRYYVNSSSIRIGKFMRGNFADYFANITLVHHFSHFELEPVSCSVHSTVSYRNSSVSEGDDQLLEKTADGRYLFVRVVDTFCKAGELQP